MDPFSAALLVICTFALLGLPIGLSMLSGSILYLFLRGQDLGLVAERLLKYASVVGKENVIAGVDCGLGTRVGHESIVWAKFASISAISSFRPRRIIAYVSATLH